MSNDLASSSTTTTFDGDASAVLTNEAALIIERFELEHIASHLLRRAHLHAEDLFAQEFAQEHITPRQKAALIMVCKYPGLSQNALAERLHMDRNTVSAMVQRLLTARLLQRQAAEDDQRAYQLYLAPMGAQLLNRVMPRDALVESRVIECLPEEYRALFLKCLRLMATAYKQVPPDGVSGAEASATNTSPC